MKLSGYHRASSLEEAKDLLRGLGETGMPLAGGTSHAFLKGDGERVAVDLAGIGYEGVERRGDVFVIGAQTRIADLQAYHADGWVLDAVALQFVNQQLRNMTTLGGNIARVFPWSDFPVALLALGADITVSGETERSVPADVYFKGQPANRFAPGELLTGVHVPALAEDCGFAYHKEKVVNADYSKMTVAVWLRMTGKKVTDIRIAVGAGLPMPKRLSDLETALRGHALSAASLGTAVDACVEPVNWRASDGCSAGYVKQLARVHLADTVLAAARSAVRKEVRYA